MPWHVSDTIKRGRIRGFLVAKVRAKPRANKKPAANRQRVIWRRRRHTAETRNRAPKNRNRRDFWEEEKPRRKGAANKVRREEPAEGDDEVPSAERRGFCPSREPTRINSQRRCANRRARVVQRKSSASKKTCPLF